MTAAMETFRAVRQIFGDENTRGLQDTPKEWVVPTLGKRYTIRASIEAYAISGRPRIDFQCKVTEGDAVWWEPFATLTVNMPQEQVLLQENEILVKVWGENEEFVKFMKEQLQGKFEVMRDVPINYVKGEIWKLIP